jgi:glycosyltransferase involved in cell wall biosynthesis
MSNHPKSKLLIFIVAYNAEKTINLVLSRIPADLKSKYDVQILAIDDASTDNTFMVGKSAQDKLNLPFNFSILRNPKNLGYGGNQKVGYHYAIENSFDYVALIHGDGQYAPECLPALMMPFNDSQVGAVFGSRMMKRGDALRGGMPLYKYVGNKILTSIENSLLKSHLSEFHSGYRIYKVDALKEIPFDLNTNDFHFDTEIIIQLVAKSIPIVELPIPTYYGDEICRVNGLKYAKDVLKAVMQYRAQRLGIFYDPRFNFVEHETNEASQYIKKANGSSTHTQAFKSVSNCSRVLDLGCAGGYMGEWLKSEKKCYVYGVDRYSEDAHKKLDKFYEADLSNGLPRLDFSQVDICLLLDVIEHLPRPEQFVSELHQAFEGKPTTKFLVSTGNIAFIVVRLMLMFGYFNYGKRGILDMTHTRLFTFSSFRRLWLQGGFEIISEMGIPIPFDLIIKNHSLRNLLYKINQFLILLCPGLFSYQIFFEVRPLPSLPSLLLNATEHSRSIS